MNAVAFAPHNENILITGSADKVRYKFDRAAREDLRRILINVVALTLLCTDCCSLGLA